jgi:hypothetical protein
LQGKKCFQVVFGSVILLEVRSERGDVPQASQLLLSFPVDFLSTLPFPGRRQLFYQVFQPFLVSLQLDLLDEVVLFVEILLQVIKLRPRRIEKLFLVLDDSPKRSATHVVEWIQRLKIDGSFLHLLASDQRKKGNALQEWRLFRAEDIADCGKYIDMTDIFIGPSGLDPRPGYDQRDPESAAVGKIAMGELPVFAQGFSMVSG